MSANVSNTGSTRLMGPDQHRINVRVSLSIKALELVLKTGVPQPLLYFFPGFFSKDDVILHEQKDKKWQISLFESLVSKGALDKTVRSRTGDAFYVIKNRYFINTLLQESVNGTKLYALRELIYPDYHKEFGESDLSVQKSPPSVRPAALMEPFLFEPTIDAEDPDHHLDDPEEDTEEGPETESLGSDLTVIQTREPVKKPARIDAAAVYDLLQIVAQREEATANLQVQIAETLAYVKDDVIFLREKYSSLSKRMKSIDEQISTPTPEAPVSEVKDGLLVMVDVIGSLIDSVNSLREEVKSAMQSNSGLNRADKLTHVAEAIVRLTGEIGVIRELASEAMVSEVVEPSDG